MSLSRGPPTQPLPRGLGRARWPSPPGFGPGSDRSTSDPDPTFSGDGRLITHFSAGDFSSAHEVALRSDGRIVAAGDAATDLALARYLP
ncbi:hypothetical protein [Streptomyces mexicanus]|uniref:Uncharacterized protein n=1 Tax=Streptomyces mexicanus TaxID=178566 RepID=A0A7X1HZC0_9ACTN|nr:hypothetical protein [Streptomyces mexicanus]MBC2865832.1 hypothetical protein [Streptomyces mexicanus]